MTAVADIVQRFRQEHDGWGREDGSEGTGGTAGGDGAQTDTEEEAAEAAGTRTDVLGRLGVTDCHAAVASAGRDWMRDNEMEVGIKHSGVMVVGKSIEVLRRTPERWQISGETVLIMDTCQYLGTEFRAELGKDKSMGDQFEKGQSMV